jgi:hypothetical protein
MIKASRQDIPTFEEFQDWMKDNVDVVIDSSNINHYNTAAMRMKDQLEKSSFWKLLCKSINEYNDEYFGIYGTDLLKERKNPVIVAKPGVSFVDKVYRENFVNNLGFPKKPEGGWVTPDNWFERINDIVRTTIVVRYLDGIEYIASRLEGLCSRESRLIGKCKYLAKIEGYYAAHLYFRMDFEIPGMRWDTRRVVSPVEMQITTQVKEMIKELLYPHYAEERSRRYSEGDVWQWRYESPEFARNYLGHIIHYVEGMMVGIRGGVNEGSSRKVS